MIGKCTNLNSHTVVMVSGPHAGEVYRVVIADATKLQDTVLTFANEQQATDAHNALIHAVAVNQRRRTEKAIAGEPYCTMRVW